MVPTLSITRNNAPSNGAKTEQLSRDGPVRRLIEQVLGKRDLMSQHKTIIRAFGGDRTTAALFEALGFWDRKGWNPAWVYKTIEEWQEELICTRYRLRRSIQKLLDMGLLERERRLCPKGTTPYHYRLTEEAADWLLQALGECYQNVGIGRKRPVHRTKTSSTPDEIVLSSTCSTVLDFSSDMQFWGGSDSEVGTQGTQAAPPLVQAIRPEPPPPRSEESADVPDPYFAALVEICRLDTSGMATGDGYSRALGLAVTGLKERHVAPSEVRVFGRWWRECHMRNGSPPEIRQVVPNWLRFTEWRKCHAPPWAEAGPPKREAMVESVLGMTAEERGALQKRSREERDRVTAQLAGLKRRRAMVAEEVSAHANAAAIAGGGPGLRLPPGAVEAGAGGDRPPPPPPPGPQTPHGFGGGAPGGGLRAGAAEGGLAGPGGGGESE